MNKHIICCPFATLEGYNGSANLSGNSEALDIYLKNASVSCFSAKQSNPDCDVAFVHNLQKLPEKYQLFFEKYNIKSIYVKYGNFTFAADYKWSLAFYKLCVLNYFANEGAYDAVLVLDTDTYITGNLDAIWPICKERLMLYNVQHSGDLEAYQKRLAEYKVLYEKDTYPTVWGGEFVAASKPILKEFVDECLKVYELMNEKGFETTFGDEFITFCAAENYDKKIADGAPYIRRYWTTNLYYQAFTDHALMLRILHIPNEKTFGFIRIFDYICKHGKLPEKSAVYKIMGLPKAKRPIYIRNSWFHFCRKIKKLLGRIGWK